MTTLIADPCVAAIPMIDNGEPLVDVTSRGIGCRATTVDCPAGATARRLVRGGIADRLAVADAALPVGIRLLVVEGLRTQEDQRAILATYSQQLRRAFPRIAEAEVRRLASRYVAPLHVAPHVAGAAVDVTLVDSEGQELPMGTAVDATPEETGNAIAFAAGTISADARANRTLLASVLTSVGLVNYPTEWWHWSYGDRYWAHVTGAAAACYGPVTR